jgi:hypothetical protein
MHNTQNYAKFFRTGLMLDRKKTQKLHVLAKDKLDCNGTCPEAGPKNCYAICLYSVVFQKSQFTSQQNF